MNINKNHKSIDSYFESARKQKSPVSRDKASSLLEKDGLINSHTQTFFSKKGVKTMTVATSIIIIAMIGSIGLGIFDDNSIDTKPDKQPIAISKEIKSEPQETANISEATKKEESQNVSLKTSKVETENNTKIKGMNTITLSEIELNELGILLGFQHDSLTLIPSIQYWTSISSKTAEFSAFTKKFSNHIMENLPSEFDIKYIRFDPAIITNFDGTKRRITEISSDNLPVLDEFINFHRKLHDLYKLDFNSENQPDTIPDEIHNKLIKLNSLLEVFQSNNNLNKDNSVMIDKLLDDVYKYFNVFAKDNLDERDKFTLSKEDTNFQSIMIAYPENADDSLYVKHKAMMAKMGIKVIYAKPRVRLNTFLKQNYKDLELQLSAINSQIENYVLSNKLIAIKIHYKNDTENLGLIFWFYPTSQLIDFLPERYRFQLKKEFKLIENNEPYCGAPIDIEKAYLDVWRTCSGAIENLRIFPNPVKDFLNIKFELKENRDITFVVHDLTGRKVKDVSKTEYYNTGTISVSLNLSNILQGMYYIVAKSNSNEQVMQRFIKE